MCGTIIGLQRRVQRALDEEGGTPQLGGTHAEVHSNSPLARIPVTVSENDEDCVFGAGPADMPVPSDTEDDTPGDDDAVFWTAWLQEMVDE